MYLKSFKELIVWRKSIELVEEIYVLTGHFPKEETYGLSMQMCRASVSIPSNIAEDQRRKDLPEFLKFLRIADASSAELETQLIISKKIYPNLNYFKAKKLLEEVQKMLYKMKETLELKAKNSKLKANNGFTVIELIVSMSLFVIISGIIAGSFITSVRTQRELISLTEARDNMGIAMEQMAREIRMGTNFEADNESGNELKFYPNGAVEQIKYKFEPNSGDDYGVLYREKGLSATSISVFPDNIKIKNFKIKHQSRIESKNVPDRITISFLAVPNDENLRNNFSFNVQTTVSARQF